MTATVLAENIARLRKHLGLKQEDFAARVKSAQTNVSKWERRNIVPDAVPLSIMAELAGVSVSDFASKPWHPKEPDLPRTIVPDAGETVEIEQLDLSVPMGPGTYIEDYVEATKVAFDIAFLRAITRSSFNRLKLITGHGHSMEPTLFSSDLIMVDTTDRSLSRQDGIYWISVFGASALKRLRAIGPGRILVMSDNKTVGDYEVDAEDLRIEGRAIWYARGL